MTVVETARLRLVPMTVEAVDALIAGDRVELEAEVGAVFPDPLRPPPETGDVLGFFRELAADPSDWTPRLVLLKDPPTVLGSCGCSPPDVDGRCVCGYGIYPEYEGNGYATEALLGLIEMARRNVDVSIVVATIHPYNVASRRVAEKAGLRVTGEMMDEREGRLEVWERRVR